MLINGKERVLDRPLSVQALLNEYMLSKKVVVIHVNGVLIPTEKYKEVMLTNDDSLQLTTIVAGG